SVGGGSLRSKTLIPKNKNKIFPKFLSPYYRKSYAPHNPKKWLIFRSKLHTRLIIEGLLFSLSAKTRSIYETRIKNNQ
ncbi:MAG: hypothetical protein ACYSU4_17195, partial [Planctomycetota bacterium]